MKSFKPCTFSITICCLLFCLGTEISYGQQSTSTTPDKLSLGTIDFPTSATGKAQKEFLTGVLALHSFWYPEARDHFQKAQELNPQFAMAYWGEAMTYDHPMWRQHDQAKGKAVLKKMDAQNNLEWNDREKAYVGAIRILYDTDFTIKERRQKYAQAMKKVTENYPSDDEAAAFSALASMSVLNFNFESKEDVMPVATVLEDLYKRKPKYPGAMHYLIHVYDSDTFAKRGLRPANAYANVAYSSSHAIHMPSHIYKRLKMWDKVIKSNISAYEASVEWQQETNRPLKDRDYHAYSWLFDAYLKVDSFEKACDMIHELHHIAAKAEKNGEETGYITSTLSDFEKQYQKADGAPACTEE